jgi:hypothetical protein
MSSSNYGGYNIVNVVTDKLAQFNQSRAESGNYRVMHYSIILNGKTVGAITNEHYEGNYRIIKLDGSQACPWGPFEKICLIDVCKFIFEQTASFWDYELPMYRMHSLMGFTYYLTVNEGYWSATRYPCAVTSRKVPDDLQEIIFELRTRSLHPFGDSIISIEKVTLS